MTGNEYQQLATRTNDKKNSERLIDRYEDCPFSVDFGGVICACLGLSGEVGELNDMIKKWVFHEAEMDWEHLEKEIGDVLWYIAMMCESLGYNMETIMQMNIDKLKKRYPKGFDAYRANHKDPKDI